MAKAKILADRISITSEILTDENIRKVRALAPSYLRLADERVEDEVLYEVNTADNSNVFSEYGAIFKDGKSYGIIPQEIMEDEHKEDIVKDFVTAVLMKVNVIEEQVQTFLDNAPDLDADIDFLD